MNSVYLIGNLTRDPNVTSTRSGKTLVRMTVACSESYRGRDGEMKEKTQFVPVTCWPPCSEIAQSFTKGDRILVMGRFTTSSYEKDGQKRYYSEVTANYVGRMPGSGKKPAAPAGQGFDDMGHNDPNEEIPF